MRRVQADAGLHTAAAATAAVSLLSPAKSVEWERKGEGNEGDRSP